MMVNMLARRARLALALGWSPVSAGIQYTHIYIS